MIPLWKLSYDANRNRSNRKSETSSVFDTLSADFPAEIDADFLILGGGFTGLSAAHNIQSVWRWFASELSHLLE